MVYNGCLLYSHYGGENEDIAVSDRGLIASSSMRSSTEKEAELEAAYDDAGPFNLKH